MASVQLRVRPSRRPLYGSVPVVADAEILERALLFAALAQGVSEFVITHPPANLQVCLRALALLGVETRSSGAGKLQVVGRGLRGLAKPEAPLRVAGAPVLGRGLVGCLSAQRFTSEVEPFETEQLDLDLRSLASRGARGVCQGQSCRLGPTEAPLGALNVSFSAPASLSKHLLLTSGLYAAGPTVIAEPLVSADHSERMLAALGLGIECMGPVVRLEPPASDDALCPFELDVPGSPAAAAFLLGAAAVLENSHVTLRHVALNPTRAGSYEALRALGANLGMTPRRQPLNELTGEVSLQQRPLSGGRIGGELMERMDHELFALSAVAAQAAGETVFFDVSRLLPEGELAKLMGFLRSFGVKTEKLSDGFSVQGTAGRPFAPSRVTTGGDPRLAALGVLLGLAAGGDSVIDDVGCLVELFPRFVGTLRALGANLEVIQ